MTPGYYGITIYQGETWAETWTRSGVSDATGWAATLEIRAEHDWTSSLLLQLTSSGGIALSSDGTRLVMVITITDDQSAALLSGTAFYDLKLGKPGGTTEYLLTGEVAITRRVTA